MFIRCLAVFASQNIWWEVLPNLFISYPVASWTFQHITLQAKTTGASVDTVWDSSHLVSVIKQIQFAFWKYYTMTTWGWIIFGGFDLFINGDVKVMFDINEPYFVIICRRIALSNIWGKLDWCRVRWPNSYTKHFWISSVPIETYSVLSVGADLFITPNDCFSSVMVTISMMWDIVIITVCGLVFEIKAIERCFP